MKVLKMLVLTVVFVTLLSAFLHEMDKKIEVTESKPVKNVSVIIVYDNNPYREELKTAWGFSCIVKSEKTILFDTGGCGTVLLENMKKLNLDPKEVDIIVLSHIHSDHVGGLLKFLERNHEVTVYLPKSFPEDFKEKIKKYGAKIIEVQKPIEICDGVYSTGEMGSWIKEQSLIVQTERGLIVITGCAHPGIVKVVKRAKDLLKKNILLVVGGFHLIGKGEKEIREIVLDFRKLGVKYVAPCHCSGDTARKLFREEYKANFINVGVGRVINVNDLK